MRFVVLADVSHSYYHYGFIYYETDILTARPGRCMGMPGLHMFGAYGSLARFLGICVVRFLGMLGVQWLTLLPKVSRAAI